MLHGEASQSGPRAAGSPAPGQAEWQTASGRHRQRGFRPEAERSERELIVNERDATYFAYDGLAAATGLLAAMTQ